MDLALQVLDLECFTTCTLEFPVLWYFI